VVHVLTEKTLQLKACGVQLIHVLDHCQAELKRAADSLRTTKSADLITADVDREINARTLSDFQFLCGFPAF
jgi:hypothetical protein